MEHSHSPRAIRERLASDPGASYLRDWIYGAIDGAVTTFAIVAGAVGADLSGRVVLILGIANLLADGFSMAAGNYSGTKAELDDQRRLHAVEKRHIAMEPEGEREEIRAIFRAKGFEGADLERVVDVITADEERWIGTMLTEEYGLPAATRQPLTAALSTFAAFVVAGAVPLVPFVLGLTGAATIAVTATGVVFFAIGSIKSAWATSTWWLSGLETLGIGLAAAGIAWVIGAGLDRLV